MNFSISLFDTSEQRVVRVERAAFLTSDLVSQMASVMVGMMSGMRRAICSGAETTSWLRISSEPVLTCHLPAVRICSRRIGRKMGTLHDDETWTTDLTAWTAASRTTFSLSANVSATMVGMSFS